jgi:hypothetical protein
VNIYNHISAAAAAHDDDDDLRVVVIKVLTPTFSELGEG